MSTSLDRNSPNFGGQVDNGESGNKKIIIISIIAIFIFIMAIAAFVAFMTLGDKVAANVTNSDAALVENKSDEPKSDYAFNDLLSRKSEEVKPKQPELSTLTNNKEVDLDTQRELVKKRLELERFMKQLAADNKKKAAEIEELKALNAKQAQAQEQARLLAQQRANATKEEKARQEAIKLRKHSPNIFVSVDSPGSDPHAAEQDKYGAEIFLATSADYTSKEKRRYLLQHGTSIPCIMRSRIVSEYAGEVICNVPLDIYSATGEIKLIDKGAQVFGSQSVALAHGKARMFITWNRLTNPNGVSLNIDSLATDSTGAAGVAGFVDNHFKERFGSAILLSFLNDAFANLFDGDDDGNTFTTDNSQSNVEEMAAIALENSIDIPPTGYLPIGQRINILLVRDIDFSSVYSLRKASSTYKIEK